MAADVNWRVAGWVRAQCHVYADRAPILTVWDVDGVSVSITGGNRWRVSVRHAESARVFAEQVRCYAEECARWVPPQRVVVGMVCGGCGSDRIDDGLDGDRVCTECGEASRFTEVYADTGSPGEQDTTGTAQ